MVISGGEALDPIVLSLLYYSSVRNDGVSSSVFLVWGPEITAEHGPITALAIAALIEHVRVS